MKHNKDCELGDNWKDCPACLVQEGKGIEGYAVKTIAVAVLQALQPGKSLSTDALCAPVANYFNIVHAIGTHELKQRVYQAARKLESTGLVASSKVWNGKGYERVWTLNPT